MPADLKVSVFLPCRRGSERVPEKNVRPFAGRPRGLLQVKLAQLLAVPAIDEVVVSSNDDSVLAYAAEVAQAAPAGRVRLHRRDEALSASHTSTDALVGHAAELIPEGHILWTHVTSPFFGREAYAAAIGAYRQALSDGHDSLMSVNALHTFLWSATQPLNYDRRVEKWPRTQTLEPVYEVNSAVFLHSAEGYRTRQDRIGAHPHLLPTTRVAGFDIDWPEDFAMAEWMAQAGHGLD